jgi:hypothetical protein
MAIDIRKWSEALIQQRFREGYGEGEGAAYKPWLSAANLSSAGRTRHTYSARFGRTIELPSDAEPNIFMSLGFSKEVTQPYGGFALDRGHTLQIAVVFGIRYPPNTTKTI